MLREPKTGQILIEPNTASAPLIVNEAFYRLAALVNVIDSTLLAPPAAPDDGDAYLIPSGTPTGKWTGLAKCTVFWYSSRWNIINPIAGQRTYCKATTRYFQYISGAWVCIKGPYYFGDSTSTVTFNMWAGSVIRLNVVGVYTLNYPSAMLPGRIYTAHFENNTGTSRLMTFQTGGWMHSVTGHTILAGGATTMQFMKDPSASRALVLNIYNRGFLL
jgi:hypothetical protein